MRFDSCKNSDGVRTAISLIPIAKFRGTALVLLLFSSLLSTAALAVELEILQQWNLFETYGREGHVGVRAFVDVDDDGQREALFNLGAVRTLWHLRWTELNFGDQRLKRRTQKLATSRGFPKKKA